MTRPIGVMYMRTTYARTALRAAAASIALMLGGGFATAQAATTTVNLTAQRTQVALPDGNSVPMWGYCSADVNGAAALGGATLAGGACAIAPAATPWTPGPTITVPAGNTLTINLTNSLPTVTSIVILGQLSTDLGVPTKVASPTHNPQVNSTWQNNAATPTPFTPPTQPNRVESFGKETTPGATPGVYTWNNLKPGTYLYETGTHPSIQAPMGLYGVIVVTTPPVTAAGTGAVAVPTVTTPGTAYPTPVGATANPYLYDADAVALFSEIDPVQNAAVDKVAAAGTINEVTGCVGTLCYPAAVNYAPVYYLLNGAAFDRSNPTKSVIGLPQAATAGSTLTGRVMVRMANAGLRMHTPTIVGPTMAVIAEDGHPAPGNPKLQTEIVLPAGKTMDALFSPTRTASANAYDLKAYSLFDRALGLSNNNQRDGGGQGFLAVLDATGGTGTTKSPFTALNNLGIATTAPTTITTSFTIPLNSVAQLKGNVLGGQGGITTVATAATAAKGALALKATGDFTYTPTTAPTACTPAVGLKTCPYDSFTTTATTTTGTSATVTVSINVMGGSTVTANPDTYNAPGTSTATSSSSSTTSSAMSAPFPAPQIQTGLSGSCGSTGLNFPIAGTATAGPTTVVNGNVTTVTTLNEITRETCTTTGPAGARTHTLTTTVTGGTQVVVTTTVTATTTSVAAAGTTSKYFRAGGNFGGNGLLANDTDSAGYALSACAPAATGCAVPNANGTWTIAGTGANAGLTVTLNAEGSFTAALATPMAAGAAPKAYTFQYAAKNSQGIVSAPATATVYFAGGNGPKLTLIDALTNNPLPTQTAGPVDYRWVIEEDRTFHTPLGTALAANTKTLATSFFNSYMPVIASGCTGPISCQTANQKVAGTAVAADATRYVTPDQVVLDPTKWYFISILPGDGANPAITGNFGDVRQCWSGSGNTASFAANCGHSMGGTSIRPAQTAATVKIQPTPLTPAQLSVYIYEDNAPLNGDPDEAEQGLGGFEIIVVDVGGRTAGDPVGQITYDAFNMPLSNALLGQYGCPDTQNQSYNAAHDTQVGGAGGPNFGHLTGVIYTCPNGSGDHPVANVAATSHATVGGVAGTWVAVTTQDNHQLYNGTSVTLACRNADGTTFNGACLTGGPNGTASAAGVLAGGAITTTTEVLADGTTTNNITVGTSQVFNVFVPDATIPLGSVTILAGKTLVANDPNQFSLAGQAVIKNLMPGRFDVIAHPGAAREGAGEKWYQTSTLEGTPGQDAFTKAKEPVYFQEFGPPGFHTQIGWINADHIAAVNKADGPNNVNTYTNSISGRITSLHMSRPIEETLWDSASRTPLAHTTCLVALNETTGNTNTIAFANCDDQGNFTLQNVPPGDYEIVAWDTWLDQIIAKKAMTVPVRNGQKIAVGDIAVFSWFTRFEANMFLDQDGTHKPSANNPTLSLSPVTIRYRDGSIVSIGNTDGNGHAEFAELFPLFNWYVVEADTSRYKPTAVHVVVDAGGKPDVSGDFAGILNSTYKAAPAAYMNLGKCAVTPGSVVTAPCAPNGGTGKYLGTERVDPATAINEGLQGFVNQTAMMDFGRVQYGPNETGGIVGHVAFASTRGFDDPRLLVQNLWEPLVPNVTVNLYTKTVNPDGSTTLTFAATTKTQSWDSTMNAVGASGIQTNVQCPGQLPGPTANQLQTSPPSFDPFVPWFLGADQFRCYDGFHQWNQVQPAAYDGYYQFSSFTDATGKATGPLTAGTYVVEMIPPAGYEVAKEEDKNILIGDFWTSPATQQFATLANIFILPDQATLNNANPGNPCNGDTSQTNPNACPAYAGAAGAGIQSNPTYDLGNTSRGDRFWPCVGATHVVPDYLAIFPGSGQVAPFAGASKPLCDKKEVVLHNQQQVLADFFIFTETPVAAHFTGLMLDDTASEINSAAPDFGEKFALGYAPVSIRDFNGVEINRVYTDQWGTFNGLTPSTWQVNVPNPAGYSPNMMITCMNDPGPTPRIDPTTLQFLNAAGLPVTDPSLAQMVKDQQYNPLYSDFCYTNPFMPGMTDYLDTPVLPVSAFASGYNPPDCEYGAGTPAVASVKGNTVFGPFVNRGAGGATLTITALGDQQVLNPLYQGPSAAVLTTSAKNKLITRHFGFGATAGTAALVSSTGTRYPLTVTGGTNSWSDLAINATVPGNVPVGDYQLVITNSNLVSSIDTVTVSIDTSAAKAWYVDQTFAPINGNCPASQQTSTIQDAINCARPGDLVLVNAGLYNELVVMWKPVRLQGVGAASVTIQSAKFPTNKLEAWRPVINTLFGIDPNTGNTASTTQVDLLPNQNTGAIVLLEPTILNTEEGPGIAVVSKGYRPDGATPLTSADCVAANAGTYLDPSAPTFVPVPNLSNFLCGASRIDGIGVTGGDSGGGIYVNGWAHNIEISNNRVFGNAGQMTGGIRVGTPNLEAQSYAPAGGYGYNKNVRVHNNSITRNGTVEPAGAGAAAGGSAGAGLTMSSGSDNYVVSNNWVCGNFSSSDGGGVGHIGASMNATIKNNTIVFNQSYSQSSTVNGGGLIIAGEQPVGGLTNGAGNVLVDSNLIQGNFAEAGHGGGIRLQGVNGVDVQNNPKNLKGTVDASGVPLPTWYTVTLTNNTIVNNVSGWSGAGISLSDALSVNVVNNTIAHNDSTGIAGPLMIAGPTTGQPSPAGISVEATSTALAAVSGKPFAAPTINNDIIVHNRSFFFNASGGTPQLCQSNAVGDSIAAAGPAHTCSAITASTVAQTTYTCPTTGEKDWDVGILGDSAATATTFNLPITRTILSPGTTLYVGANNNTAPADTALNLVKPLCNGPRANPGLQFEPGQPFLPPFTIAAAATLDEAGNFVDLQFGPLSLNDPLAANAATAATTFSDYTFGTTSSALNTGNDIGVTNHDRFGTLRPQGTAFDIGAYEQKAATGGITVDPHALAFGDVVVTAPVATASPFQTLTIANSGTGNVALAYSALPARFFRAAAPNAGTCGANGANLAGGASCTYNVVFTPNALGAVTGTLTINGSAITLTGTGVAATPTLTPAALAFGTLPAGTASAIETITLTNPGTTAVQIAAVNGLGFTGTAANVAMYAIDQTSTCTNGGVVAAGQTCTIALVFTPATVGAHNVTLNVRYTVPPLATVVTLNAALTGTGAVAANAAFDPTAVAFGAVQIGTIAPAQTVTINNNTLNLMTLNAITFGGANGNQFRRAAAPPAGAGGTCATGGANAILPGGACTINVVMAPTAPAGLKTGTLTIVHTGGGGNYVIALTGFAQPQSLVLSPNPLQMPPQSTGFTSAPAPITVTNTGAGPLTFRGIAISNGGVFSISNAVAGACAVATPVPAGATCTINVVARSNAAGTSTSVVTVNYGPAGTAAVTDNVSATFSAPSVALLPASLSFGTQQIGTTTAIQSVNIVNSGAGAVATGAITLPAGSVFAIDTTAGNCASTVIPAGGNCTVSVTFTPAAAVTTTANLTVALGNGTTRTAVLTGTGSNATSTALINPLTNLATTAAAPLTFTPAQAVGTSSAPMVLLLTNAGTGPLQVGSMTFAGAQAGDFSQANTCGTQLIVGATCQVYVTYAPVAAVAQSNAQLSVNVGGVPSPLLAYVRGTPLAAPATTLAPDTIVFPSTQIGTAAPAVTVTLTNGTATAVPFTSAAIGGANAADFSVTNNACGATVPANGSCTMSVGYKPSVAGLELATLTVIDGAGTHTSALSGVGAAPVVTVGAQSATPTAQIGTAAAAFTVTVTNGGVGAEPISAIAVAGFNPADFVQTNTCPVSPATLAPAATCAITVTFTPTTVGAESAIVSVTDAAGTQSVTVNGKGVAPSATATPLGLTFASTVGTASAAQTFTVANTGIGPITVAAPTNATAVFAATSTCPVAPATLAVNGTCTVSVVYTPATSPAADSDAVTVGYAGALPVATLLPAVVSVTGTAP